MRFLLIDPDASYRQLIKYHLSAAWPDSIVDEFAPSGAGLADALAARGLAPAGYDAVLLGFPGDREAGHAWLTTLLAGTAPVIVFAEPSDEFLAVDVLKAGAANYFPKTRVRHARLIGAIVDSLGSHSHRVAPQAATLESVRLKPPYTIIRELHSSAVSSVYLARAPGDQEEVALKVIGYVPDAGGERLFDRFLQEYELIAAIDHPNVVRILDLGIADDHAFLAMEYLAAGSLAERLNAPLAPDVAIGVARQAASALTRVHAAGILHRDLKPANMMFRNDETLALIDFGLAKDTQLALALTGNGQIFGTPYYMSPEQGHAEPTDQRSDLYSLGCVFYEMLTGRRPFTASTPMGVIYKHAHAARPLLPPDLMGLQGIVDRLLAPDRNDRYDSADDLLAALDAAV